MRFNLTADLTDVLDKLGQDEEALREIGAGHASAPPRAAADA